MRLGCVRTERKRAWVVSRAVRVSARSPGLAGRVWLALEKVAQCRVCRDGERFSECACCLTHLRIASHKKFCKSDYKSS